MVKPSTLHAVSRKEWETLNNYEVARRCKVSRESARDYRKRHELPKSQGQKPRISITWLKLQSVPYREWAHLNDHQLSRKYKIVRSSISRFRNGRGLPKSKGQKVRRRKKTNAWRLLRAVKRTDWLRKNNSQIGDEFGFDRSLVRTHRLRLKRPMSLGRRASGWVPSSSLWHVSDVEWAATSDNVLAVRYSKTRRAICAFRNRYVKPRWNRPSQKRMLRCIHSDVWATLNNSELRAIFAPHVSVTLVRRVRKEENKPQSPGGRLTSILHTLSEIDWLRTNDELSNKLSLSRGVICAYRHKLGKPPSPVGYGGRTHYSPFDMTLFSENIGELNQKQKHENR